MKPLHTFTLYFITTWRTMYCAILLSKLMFWSSSWKIFTLLHSIWNQLVAVWRLKCHCNILFSKQVFERIHEACSHFCLLLHNNVLQCKGNGNEPFCFSNRFFDANPLFKFSFIASRCCGKNKMALCQIFEHSYFFIYTQTLQFWYIW